MSIAKTIHLYCDGPLCTDTDGNPTGEPYDPSLAGSEHAFEMRERAKQDGWSQRGAKDYCPDCRKEMKLEH